VTGGEVAAAVLEQRATAIVNVARVIARVPYHFGVAVWSAKAAQSHVAQIGGTMKLDLPCVAAATTCLSGNWFLTVFLAVFLTITSASAATQTNAEEMNPAEKLVVAQAVAGNLTDLTQFPEKDRKLSAHFLEELLMGTVPGFKSHRNGVRIIGAIIEQPLELKNAQIPYEVWLHHCQFMSKVVLVRSTFAGVASFDSSEFKADFSFNDTKVGHDVFIKNAVFEGAVDFSFANIAGSLEAQGAKFQNKEREVTFNRINVGQAASFSDATFEGAVDFASANIFSFEVSRTKFQNKEREVSFNAMKVGQAAFFDNAVFEGPVDFVGADIRLNFEVSGTKFQNKEKGVSFNAMKVGLLALFEHAVFEGPVNFRYADFDSVRLESCSWPQVVGRVQMHGMSYKYARANVDEPESHRALLKLADQSSYTADVYTNLEQFFRRLGYTGDADRAFIAGKCRERTEYFSSGDWFRWLGSWMLYLLVGYGRRPWQAGIPCAVLVVLGCVLFSPKKMEVQRPDDAPRVYSRFWYSLGLFLPVVNLQADNVWKPKADQTFLRNYVRVHILLGWILIPLVLAALTGLIK
jgi:uncharacterized protein YjbI with pentapeptide repeats